ncbi:single-stranded DNA-binding protein [Candidatus Kaiserbacteria bacterium]|nr:MAG: single-stranded DNA-binding protein [Candidatus Kaiserbacteria bacterium]
MYINKVMVYGNLGRDPELKALPSGVQVASFSLATTRVYKDKDGGKKEQTDWHNIVVFGRQAETTAQYLHKGNAAFIEGRLQTRSWEKDGVKQYRTEIVADRVQFGPKAGSTGAPTTTKGDESAEPPASSGKGIEYPEEDIDPDDIPF